MGTILGNPEDIYCVGQFTAGSVSLDKKSTYDFIDLKWNTVALSLKGLDLHMLKSSKFQDGESQSETDFQE